MKTLSALLLLSLFSVPAALRAGPGHVSLQVHVDSERGSKDADKNTKTPDESRSQWLVVRVSNPSPVKLEGLTLRWTLYADDLKRGTDRIVAQKSGEQNFGVEPLGHYTDVTTPKVEFQWVPLHSERTGSGRRTSSKKVDETGRRYHGYAVQVLQDGVVIGEAYSHNSLRKTE